MKVIFAGTPELAIPSAQALLDHGHDIVAVLTRPDAPVGRKRVLTPSPVALWAVERGLNLIKSSVLTPKVNSELKALNADVGVVVAYGALLPASTLELLPHGWFNLHFSALPQYRGAAPVQRALMAGETSVSTCVFRLVEKMDAGPIASRRTFAVEPHETAQELLTRLSLAAADQASLVVDSIQTGKLGVTEQSGQATFAPKIDQSEAEFRPAESAQVNFNRFRGVTAEPGFWFLDGEQRVKVLEAALNELGVGAGSIDVVRGDVLLGCETGSLVLRVVQPAGKSAMSAIDWMRGRRS